jgi:hypothetical protein
MKTRSFVVAGALIGSGLAAALPAAAQQAQQAQQRTREIVVFGTDPCPRSTDDEVVVCARRPEKERYRLPEALRPAGPPQLSQSWSARSKALATIGQTGPGTCSGVGPGGDFGCATKEIERGVAERREQDSQDAPPE